MISKRLKITTSSTAQCMLWLVGLDCDYGRWNNGACCDCYLQHFGLYLIVLYTLFSIMMYYLQMGILCSSDYPTFLCSTTVRSREDQIQGILLYLIFFFYQLRRQLSKSGVVMFQISIVPDLGRWHRLYGRQRPLLMWCVAGRALQRRQLTTVYHKNPGLWVRVVQVTSRPGCTISDTRPLFAPASTHFSLQTIEIFIRTPHFLRLT